MSTPTKLSRAIAAYQGKDDPLAAENARLTTELSALQTKVEGFDSLMAAASKANDDHTAEISQLKEQLAAAEKAKTEAEEAKAAAETRATTAEQAAETAKADAKAQIDAKEKSVGQRANQAAIDQMASVGQPPPDKAPAAPAQTHHKTNPNEGLSGLEIARRQWATRAN